MRLVDFLDQSAALYDAGNQDARFFDVDNQLSLSYQEMVNASTHLAAFLVRRGIKLQDVVATYAPNSVAAYCCIFAISRIGAIWLPLNTRNTLSANLKLMDSSDTKFLFVDEAISIDHPEIFERFSLEQLAWLGGKKIADFDFSFLRQTAERARPDDSNLYQQNSEDDQHLELPEGALVSLFATGGTTGDSKIAEWDHVVWESIVNIQHQLMPVTDIPSCYLVAAAMTHAAGVGSFATILEGGSIVVMDGFSPEKLLAAIEAYKVTSLFLPPTAIYMLLAFSEVGSYDYASLRYFWYAAAPMSTEKLKEAMAIFGPVMVQTYGQAEAPMICAFLSSQDHVDALASENNSRLGSCGKASPGITFAIVDDSGCMLSQGLQGEIAVKGNLLMKGYHRSVEATNAIRINGWQLTGDIGVLDECGYLSILDRKGDMIISGGFNVYPGEIEQLIWGMPGIKDCAVIGLPDEKWGEQVTAVIELKDASLAPDKEEIIRCCKEKLGSIKAPKQVLVFDELPRSPVGKVLKKELRAMFWGDQKKKI